MNCHVIKFKIWHISNIFKTRIYQGMINDIDQTDLELIVPYITGLKYEFLDILWHEIQYVFDLSYISMKCSFPWIEPCEFSLCECNIIMSL